MRRVTVLEKIRDDADTMTFHVVFWVAVPTGREAPYANPAFVSVLPPDVAATGAELTNLRAGQSKEIEDNVVLAKKDGNGVLYTAAQLQTNLANALVAEYATLLANIAAYNPRALYGTYYDDTTSAWTVRSLP